MVAEKSTPESSSPESQSGSWCAHGWPVELHDLNFQCQPQFISMIHTA